MTTERAELNSLINDLPDDTIQTIKEFVLATRKAYEQMKMRAYLATIPEEEEEVSKEERAELDRAAAEPGGISLEEFKKELGL